MTIGRTHAPSRRRQRGPILQEDVVRIIAQGLPDIAPLKQDVPTALAEDTERGLRELIRQAKSYMRHAKRSHLTVEDVANASKRRDAQPVLGYGAGTGGTSVEYVNVEGTSGLYITKERIVKLTDVISKQLPPRRHEPGIEASWIAVTGRAQDEGEERVTLKRRRSEDLVIHSDFHAFREKINSALEETEDEAQVDAALKAVATATTIEPVISDFVLFIRSKVHENARATGSTEVLLNMTRFLYALFSRNRFGVESHYDRLFPALLTCLVGRKLGTGDHWSLRDLAASVLQESLLLHDDPVSRGRTAKTLIAVLTDPQSPLESLYGSIRGLSAMGEELFESEVRPHIPALLRGLEAALDACKKLEDGPREQVEERIAHVCRVLDDASIDPRSEDGELKPLMEVYL